MLKPILWLKEVISTIGGTVPLVQSTLDGRNFVKLSISFDIRSRGESSGDITHVLDVYMLMFSPDSTH